MKLFAAAVLFLMLSGCHNDLDNASANLKKGDSFYETKEYDAAEYYYEKIPEESPMYAQARMKLDSISAFRNYWSKTTASEDDLKMIILGDNSASMMKATMKPLHSFIVINNTNRTIKTLTIEFTYYDVLHARVAQLTSDVDGPVPPNSKGVFSRVEPGTLTTIFYRSEAKILGAEY